MGQSCQSDAQQKGIKSSLNMSRWNLKREQILFESFSFDDVKGRKVWKEREGKEGNRFYPKPREYIGKMEGRKREDKKLLTNKNMYFHLLSAATCSLRPLFVRIWRTIPRTLFCATFHFPPSPFLSLSTLSAILSKHHQSVWFFFLFCPCHVQNVFHREDTHTSFEAKLKH